MGKGQGPALVAQILLILCVVSDGSLLANGQETRTLQKVTTHNLLLLIKWWRFCLSLTWATVLMR